MARLVDRQDTEIPYGKSPETRARRSSRNRYEFPPKIRYEIRALANHTCADCKRTEDQIIAELMAHKCENCAVGTMTDQDLAEIKCQRCSATANPLTIHHIIPQHYARKHNLPETIVTHPLNGVCLCRECHDNREKRGLRSMHEIKTLIGQISAQINQGQQQSKLR